MKKGSSRLKPVLLPFGKTIYQSKDGLGISNDSAELVNIILKQQKDRDLRVLELGSGCGIISIMMKVYRKCWQITGLEIQSQLVDLSKKNCDAVGVKVDFIHADLKNFTDECKFHLIISNPPYYEKNEGRISPYLERAVSTHELLCTKHDLLGAVYRNLKKNGTAYLLHLSRSETEIRKICAEKNLQLDNIYPVCSSKKVNKSIYRIRKDDRIT